jgi:3-dehydroquinate dehydratase/shikimate dehydrogenase
VNNLPFYVVTLSHPTWEEARLCASTLPPGCLPEVRLDLFPEQDPEQLVDSLKGRCLVTCRKRSEGGRWDGEEADRIDRLQRALEARPLWLDLEWDLAVPEAFRPRLTRTRLLRSVHVPEGVFDLEARLRAVPEGDAFKWVGVASRLSDNARLRPVLAWARDRGMVLSAFLMGPKGIPSRALQGVWGGSFTYSAPDDGPPAAPGQIALGTLRSWRCHRIHPGHGLCGVLGSPVLHSLGPAFHNPRFQRAFKSLLYLPLECDDAAEAIQAMDSLEILGASITAPLKVSLAAELGLPGPVNTLWRRNPGEPWSSANTDHSALEKLCTKLERGPVLILGGGGVARTCGQFFSDLGCPVLHATRSSRPTAEEVEGFAPAGVVQATRLGMEAEDALPFPQILDAALPSLRWAVEWVYKTDTAFLAWARERALATVDGTSLFEAQAEAQSRIFIEQCGG